MKKLGIVLLMLGVYPASAQTYEEWLKTNQQEYAQYAQETQKGIKELQKEYTDFVKQRDKEFSEYLKQHWEQYKSAKVEKPDETPKPVQAPVVKEAEVKEAEEKNSVVVLEKSMVTNTANSTTEVSPRIKIARSIKVSSLRKTFKFYGETVIISPDRRLCAIFSGQVKENDIANYWSQMCAAAYDELIDELFAYKDRLALNDWGYYMLVKSAAESMVSDENNVQLLTWFLLNKSGYIARIGYSDNQISLLLPTHQDIYRLSYLTIDGIRFYITRPLNGGVYTYKNDLAGIDRLFDLRLTVAPNFNSVRSAQRELKMNDKIYTVRYNSSLSKFYKDYPFTTLNVYFGTPASSTLKESLLEQIMPEMVKLSATERTEWLLKFMHKAFPYKTDNEQFGYEKYFFVEEMFAYPYSDCEDRAILFSYLVKSLADLPSIGLNYPGHVSTAVALPKSISGNYFTWKNTAYTAFDPTYIGAKGGMTMPEFQEKSAEIVPVSGMFLSSNREETIRQMIKSAGGFLPSNTRHIQMSEDGAVYACGVYDQENSGTSHHNMNGNAKGIFVTKISPENTFEWTVNIKGDGEYYPEQIRLNDNRIYLYGEYNGSMIVGNSNLNKAEGRDLFLANIDTLGNVLWASDAGLDKEEHEQSYNYIVRFDSKGTVIKNNIYPLALTASEGGLAISPRNELILSGSLTADVKSQREEMKNAAVTMAVSDYLKQMSDKCVQERTEKGVAGLFAVMAAICEDQMTVSGDDAIRALNRYNPNFKKRCPNIYENINGIQTISNNGGILTLHTRNGQVVNFDKIQVSDGSKMRVVKTSNQNYKVEILDGMKVGKAFIWFKLNEMQIYGATGNLTVDYDSDHTQRTFNFSKDILN